MEFPVEVPSDAEGLRLDQFLAQQFPALSRSRWTRLLEAGAVLIDGRVGDPSQRLKTGQKLTQAAIEDVRLRRELLTALEGEQESIDSTNEPEFHGEEPTILFEDEELVVINKPCGLTVHPGHGIVFEETVAGWLAATGRVKGVSQNEAAFEEEWEEEILEERRPGIVHRLDRGTSGALVLAKNPSVHAALARQFAEREAGRLYWAVVEGSFETLRNARPARLQELLQKAPSPVGIRFHSALEASDVYVSFASRLERDPRERTRFRVSPDAARTSGKRAVTHVAQISSAKSLSLLECKLETGRTHQIRVHLSFLGYPIVGDPLYGGRVAERLWLHAHTLKLKHPRTNEPLVITAPWPGNDLAWLESQGLRTGSRAALWKTLDGAD